MMRRHPEAQAIRSEFLDVFPASEKKRPRIHFTAAWPALILSPPQHVERFGRAHVHDVELVADRFLESKQRRNRSVPDDSLEVAVCFRISLRAVIAALPRSAFDFV